MIVGESSILKALVRSSTCSFLIVSLTISNEKCTASFWLYGPQELDASIEKSAWQKGSKQIRGLRSIWSFQLRKNVIREYEATGLENTAAFAAFSYLKT